MSILGDIGSLYILILVVILIIGLGMLTKGFFHYLFVSDTKNTRKNKGGSFMQNNNTNWLKLSLFSLVGIIVSMLILSFMSSQGAYGNYNMNSGLNGTNSMQNMTGTGSTSSTSSMTGTGGMSGMSGMSGTANSGGMSNMNSTSNMSGASNMSNTGTTLDNNAIIANNFYQIQLQMNQMQAQINQLQQMIQNMSNMQSMPASSSGSSGASGSGSSSGSMSMPMM